MSGIGFALDGTGFAKHCRLIVHLKLGLFKQFQLTYFDTFGYSDKHVLGDWNRFVVRNSEQK